MNNQYSEKINFRTPAIEDREIFKRALQSDPSKTENSSFATAFLWENYFNITYAAIEDCIVLRYIMDGEKSYAFPFGSSDENKIKAVKKLSGLCKKEGIPFCLGPVTTDDKALLEKDLPGLFAFEEERSEFEYVYRKEKLIDLDEFSDLRYKKKLINQLKASGNLRYEKITPENMSLCMQVEDEWLKEKTESLKEMLLNDPRNSQPNIKNADIENNSDTEKFQEEINILNSEHELILKAFNNFKELELFGGVLLLDDKPIAFTIGEEQTEDTVIVHIEKALKGIKGAYQAINNFFVSQSCEKYSFINREEDTGDANLRQAKMSYRPDKLVEIYSAQEKKPVFRFLEKDEYQKTKEICKQIFRGEENDAFFEEFFKERIYHTRIAVLEQDGQIIATTQVWDIKISESHIVQNPGKADSAQNIGIPYFYATATLPQYRLMGFRNMLFNELFKAFEKEGRPWCFLAPENKNIWADLGFNIGFELKEEEKDILETDDEIDICLVHELIPGSFLRPSIREVGA